MQVRTRIFPYNARNIHMRATSREHQVAPFCAKKESADVTILTNIDFPTIL